MNISALVKKLESIKAKHGDLEVMFHDTDSRRGSVWSLSNVVLHNTEEDEFPKGWNMPTRFVKIDNR